MSERLQSRELSRRRVLAVSGRGAAALLAGAAVGESANAQGTASPGGSRQTAQPMKPVELPPFLGPGEKPDGPPPTPLAPAQRVGYAIVGLGRLSLEQILPAFGECKLSRPVALVTGNRDKGAKVAAQYGLDPAHVFDYASLERLRDIPAVEVVYIVLPNGMHEEFVIRSARAGKHILCEKPMANTSAQARNMIAACREASRKLMVAYRIQYEPFNREVRRLAHSGDFGAIKLMEGVNTQNQGDPNQWRQKLALAGGGSLLDIGLYCLNTARFLTGEEPIEIAARVYSTPNDPRFREVEENCLWQMRFPSGAQANFATAYGAHTSKRYRLHLERGWIDMEAAFSYRGQHLEVARFAEKAETVANRQLEPKNQFAAEMDHMSDCVIHDRLPFTPGEEGLQDHLLMEAIYRAAREGNVVTLPPVEKRDAFRGPEPSEDQMR